MAKYKIIRTDDPSQYQEKIISFWDEYLADTPSNRFEWLMHGNPAGPAFWFLALAEKTDELIGTLSLMPKDIHWNSRTFHGVIMGDLMIHKKHRVYGPTLSLLKSATKLVFDHQLDFIYTIPNPDSSKVIERAGLESSVALHDYIKPINIGHYLVKYIPSFAAKTASLLASPFFHVFSKEIFTSAKGFFEVATIVDDSFDEFWEIFCNASKKVTGCYDLKYLRWRYCQNPLQPFQILTYRKSRKDTLSGYLIFTISNNGMVIYDILSLKEEYIYKMLKKAIQIAREKKLHAIYFTIPPKREWPRILKSFGFINAKASMQVCWLSDSKIPFDNWDFSQGDRNI